MDATVCDRCKKIMPTDGNEHSTLIQAIQMRETEQETTYKVDLADLCENCMTQLRFFIWKKRMPKRDMLTKRHSWTPEAKAAASERMKKHHQRKKAEQEKSEIKRTPKRKSYKKREGSKGLGTIRGKSGIEEIA